MPFKRQRPELMLTDQERDELTRLSRSRTEATARVERAGILLAYAQGDSVSPIARAKRTNRPKVERCIDSTVTSSSSDDGA